MTKEVCEDENEGIAQGKGMVAMKGGSEKHQIIITLLTG